MFQFITLILLLLLSLFNKAISEETSENYLVKELVLEALKLENNFSELEKPSNKLAPYQNLLDQVDRVELYYKTEDDMRALFVLKLILQDKLFDMKEESSLIIDVEAYAKHLASTIGSRMEIIPEITDINDVDLKNNLNELRFRVYGNFALNRYRRFVEGFRFNYFPYAACYLESLQISTTPTAYDDLDAIASAVTDHLSQTKRHIDDIEYSPRDIFFVEGKKPDDALYIWKSADIRDKISRLFKGEQITLVADVKTATATKHSTHNALKFNKLDLIFRSSNQTVHNQLGDALIGFVINLRHMGQSAFRYNDHFYRVNTVPSKMIFSFEKTEREDPWLRNTFYTMFRDSRPERRDPVLTNTFYTMFRDSRPKLSPFTEWELKLTDLWGSRFHRLAPFEQLEIDIELHGSGIYADNNRPPCKEEALSKFYTQIEN